MQRMSALRQQWEGAAATVWWRWVEHLAALRETRHSHDGSAAASATAAESVMCAFFRSICSSGTRANMAASALGAADEPPMWPERSTPRRWRVESTAPRAPDTSTLERSMAFTEASEGGDESGTPTMHTIHAVLHHGRLGSSRGKFAGVQVGHHPGRSAVALPRNHMLANSLLCELREFGRQGCDRP